MKALLDPDRKQLITLQTHGQQVEIVGAALPLGASFRSGDDEVVIIGTTTYTFKVEKVLGVDHRLAKLIQVETAP